MSTSPTRLPLDASDREILDFVQDWIQLLANGDYTSAVQVLRQHDRWPWDPELLEKIIQGYGVPSPCDSGEVFQVTPMAEAQGEPSPPEVTRDRGPGQRVGWVFHELPLNGEWSDVAASFGLDEVDGGLYLVLEQLRVP